MAPIESVVEISKKPETLTNAFDNEGNTARTFDGFPDVRCAPAFRQQGDVFRLLPAHEYVHSEKVRKIVKSRKCLDNLNMFKYGEYLESLNEEIKVNIDEFSNYKSMIFSFTPL